MKELCNEHIKETLDLVRSLIILADEGERDSKDDGSAYCMALFVIVRIKSNMKQNVSAMFMKQITNGINKGVIMDKKLVESLNSQMNFELYSSYIYLSMASYLKSLDLNGFANWMDIQVKEEVSHVDKFYNYLHERGENVEFAAIDKPQHKWDSPLALFEHALEHEKIVTKRINDLVDQAMKVSDHATLNFLQWFVGEQVEEEASVLSVIQQIKLVGDSLFLLDRELGQRVFNPPA